jgi:hypothetical protein
MQGSIESDFETTVSPRRTRSEGVLVLGPDRALRSGD